ncbi:Factor of DNA methylation 1 [Linum perenne]
MGIVVNVSMELESQVLENGYWLEKFARYKIVDVHVLLYQECLKAQVVVKFSSDWNGLAKSAEFENNFKSQHCGKEDWKGREKDDCNYHPFHGWIAHRDDYDFEGVIGEYLRKEAQLKTVSGVSQETVKSRKTETTRLTEELCESNKNLSEWQYKYHKKARNLSMVIQDKDQFHDHIVEDYEMDDDSAPSVAYFDNLCTAGISDWNGQAKSAEFEKYFISQHCGKEDWKGREKDDCNYHPFHGWIAHRDDYDFEDVIREYLRKEAQLKTLSETRKLQQRLSQENDARALADGVTSDLES